VACLFMLSSFSMKWVSFWIFFFFFNFTAFQIAVLYDFHPSHTCSKTTQHKSLSNKAQRQTSWYREVSKIWEASRSITFTCSPLQFLPPPTVEFLQSHYLMVTPHKLNMEYRKCYVQGWFLISLHVGDHILILWLVASVILFSR
jgi:hypothetical protein